MSKTIKINNTNNSPKKIGWLIVIIRLNILKFLNGVILL